MHKLIVYKSVYADLSTDLLDQIPGEYPEKASYLRGQFEDHFPNVDIVESTDILKVKGPLKVLVGLHDILETWYHAKVKELNVQMKPAFVPNVNSDRPKDKDLSLHMENDKNYYEFNKHEDSPVIRTSIDKEVSASDSTINVSLPGYDVPAVSMVSLNESVPAMDMSCSGTINDSCLSINAENEQYKRENFTFDQSNAICKDFHIKTIKDIINEKVSGKMFTSQSAQTDKELVLKTRKRRGRQNKRTENNVPLKIVRKVKRKNDDPQKNSTLERKPIIVNNDPPSRGLRNRKEKQASFTKDQNKDSVHHEENNDDDIDYLLGGTSNSENILSSNVSSSENNAPGDVISNNDSKAEIYQETRGRKPKSGPIIEKHMIDDYLPPAEYANESEELTCELCKMKFKGRKLLKQHLVRCHMEKKFACKHCGKRYGNIRLLTKHQLTHTRKYSCEKCSRRFYYQAAYDKHLEFHRKQPNGRVKHKTMEELQCKQCDYVAKQKKNLLDHIGRKHSDKIYTCPVCDKTFGLRKDLNCHIKFHSETFQCEQCGKTLKSKLALKLHINSIHKGIAPPKQKEYVCDHCGKICKNKTNYTEHLNKEHLNIRPHKCTQCDMAFFSNHSLKCHLKTHSDVRDYFCDVCGKSFKHSNGLRVHRVSHSEVWARPYACETCNKTFTQRGALKRHERIHTGDRPYKCKLCESSFNDYSILRRHVLGVHKINDRSFCGRFDLPENAPHGRPKVAGPSNYSEEQIATLQNMQPIKAEHKTNTKARSQAQLPDVQALISIQQEATDATLVSQALAPHTEMHLPRTEPTTQLPTHIQTVHINAANTQFSAHDFPHLAALGLAQSQGNIQTIQASNIMYTPPGTTVAAQAAHSAHTYTMPPTAGIPGVLPVSVVNDIVQSALYDPQHLHTMEAGFPSITSLPMFQMAPAPQEINRDRQVQQVRQAHSSQDSQQSLVHNPINASTHR